MIQRNIRFLAIFGILALAFAAPAFSQGFEVKTHTLKNGMKILVQEDHSIPNVALYIFYRIGSRNERPGITGIAHFFEHMMFNGAKKYGPGEFDRTLGNHGGSCNAYTTQDITVYNELFPSSATELVFELEADRIQNLAFDPKKIESERGVVSSERRASVDDNNGGILDEQLGAAAFTVHPYRWPVIGRMADIQSWTLDDLKSHFKAGYSPSNATLVVSGDITFDEIVKLAEKYIEPIPASAPPPEVVIREPEQTSERRVVVRKPAQLPILMVAYHIPETAHPDYYPLQVLQTMLFWGQSSRMYKRIVDKDQLALSIGGGSGWSFDPSLFSITAWPREGVDPEAVEKALYEEIDNVKTSGVTGEELEKAKNIVLAGFYRQVETLSGRSNSLGTYEIFFGDYRKLFSAADDVAKVTEADVKRVAKQYFSAGNRTVATLIPETPPAPTGEKLT